MSGIYFERLNSSHEVQSFENESEYIRWWLAEQAIVSQNEGETQTFVAMSGNGPFDISHANSLVGYFTISTNIIKPVVYAGADVANGWPVVVILAIGRDRRRRGHHIGDLLLIEAMRYSHAVSRITGARGVYLYALEGSESLYDRLGFEHFEGDRKKRWLSMSVITHLPVIQEFPVRIITHATNEGSREI